MQSTLKQIASCFCFGICKIYLLGNVQYERVANISDIVRRGLGMLLQQAEQAIFEKSQEGNFSKMSKHVQVYTACEFVKWYLFTLLASICGELSKEY